MPAILRLILKTDRQTNLSPQSGPLQGWFLQLLKSVSSDWSARFHRDGQIPPYMLSWPYFAPDSPLRVSDPAGKSDQAVVLPANQSFGLRIGFAHTVDAVRLAESLQYTPLPPLVGSSVQLVRRPNPYDPNDPDSRLVEWIALQQKGKSDKFARGLRLTFLSPTAFKSNGSLHLLPEPRFLFQSWLRQWDTFAPLERQAFLPDGEEWLHDPLPAVCRIAAYDLTTTAVHLKGGTFRGFIGSLDLEWVPGAEFALRTALTTLALGGTILGVGTKTSLGMGQVRTAPLESMRNRRINGFPAQSLEINDESDTLPSFVPPE